MKQRLIIIFVLFYQFNLTAQSEINKSNLDAIFIETLEKSRNAVKTASNEWRYDNSNDDYFIKDTITLNTARSYRKNYCKEINWSFYREKDFVINRITECTEPPTKLISKKKDTISLSIEELDNRVLFDLYNFEGRIERFEVIELTKNQPIFNEANQFDYTVKLVRVE
jgi:hypothetical protein